MNKLLLITFLLLQSAAAVAAPAGDTPARNSAASQDHAQIRNLVADFVRQQTAALPGKVAYQVDEIDRRIVLPQCAKLEAFLPAGSQLTGKTSVGVRCHPPSRNEEANAPPTGGWNIFVPVQIRLSLNLLTSARQLPLGHTLQEQDIATQSTDSSLAGGFTDPKQVIGKVLRYGIAAGQVLREDMLRQPYSVTQGQVVTLAVQGNGFSIRSEGVALNNASEGQAVQVRVGPGRVISGVARAGGVVEIAP
ncbi:flagellar basal body P-ring formation chaperone FlgA [Candidatus Ferrigenium straubiae]|jgi:flagella basal body P-ring formation protein FlgA|uniref:flagellar basal body P-ring formation chaperone FlgA n=1 Tax=Candidatus Ferrigenium straubiae TaxID=2919506 RepID=UPI003F4A9ED4